MNVKKSSNNPKSKFYEIVQKQKRGQALRLGQDRGPSAAASSSNEHKNSSNEPKNIAQICIISGLD